RLRHQTMSKKPEEDDDPILEAAADYDPANPDHGLMELKTESELVEQMRERGFQFSYACYQDGNKDACHSLGQWLSMWRKQPAEGAAVFKHNCDLHGHAESCFKYANYKRNGPHGHPVGAPAHPDCDPAEANAYYDRACNRLLHRRSCICLARSRLLDGGRSAGSLEAGMALLRRACLGPGDRDGVGLACVSAAVECLQAGQAAEARKLAGTACDAGDGAGCGLLAVMMRRGDGGPTDVDEANRLSQRAKGMNSEYGQFLQQAKARQNRREAL
uniref:TPR_REGION domain-containing protein n=2 Tax=Macrostomum lignano TaxID=282301 RepID=A0A1I8JN14_9PLAT